MGRELGLPEDLWLPFEIVDPKCMMVRVFGGVYVDSMRDWSAKWMAVRDDPTVDEALGQEEREELEERGKFKSGRKWMEEGVAQQNETEAPQKQEEQEALGQEEGGAQQQKEKEAPQKQEKQEALGQGLVKRETERDQDSRACGRSGGFGPRRRDAFPVAFPVAFPAAFFFSAAVPVAFPVAYSCRHESRPLEVFLSRPESRPRDVGRFVRYGAGGEFRQARGERVRDLRCAGRTVDGLGVAGGCRGGFGPGGFGPACCPRRAHGFGQPR